MAYDTNRLAFELSLTFPVILKRVFDSLFTYKDEECDLCSDVFIRGDGPLRYNPYDLQSGFRLCHCVALFRWPRAPGTVS